MKKRGNHADHSAAETILAAGARLFADRGYDATSMREVAEAARVAKPTIYYYFQSKEGLFDALLEHAVSSLCESFGEINARPVCADARECLVDAVFAGFEFAREHPDMNRFIHGLVFSPIKRRERQAIEREFARVMAEFGKVFARVAGAGLMEAARIPAAALVLRGCMMAYVVQFLQGKVELSRRLAGEIVEGFLCGYGKCPPGTGAGNTTRKREKR